MTVEKLSRLIAKELFTAGDDAGKVATELRLMIVPRDGSREFKLGGWCEDACARQIQRLIEQNLDDLMVERMKHFFQREGR